MVVVPYASPGILKSKSGFVMNAFEERKKIISIAARKNSKLLVIEPPKTLFKVLVNNYRQKETSLSKHEEEVGEMMINHQSLPPQPSGYLKFPEHDWF